MPKRQKHPVEAKGRTIVVSTDVLDLLEPPTARRGVSVNKLCRALLVSIADDNLVDAVLEEPETVH